MPAGRRVGRSANRRQSALRACAEVTCEPENRLIQHLRTLAESEARVTTGRFGLIESGNRNGGYPRLLGYVATKSHVVPGEPKRGEIRGHEVAAHRRQHLHPKPGEAVGESVALSLQVRGKGGEIGVVLP